VPIYGGLAGFRVRPDAEPVYTHAVCKQELKRHPGLQDSDQLVIVLRCDACNVVVGEWVTEQDMQAELAGWFEENAA